MEIINALSNISLSVEAIYFEKKKNADSLKGKWKDDIKIKDVLNNIKSCSDVISNSCTKATMVSFINISIFGKHQLIENYS